MYASMEVPTVSLEITRMSPVLSAHIGPKSFSVHIGPESCVDTQVQSPKLSADTFDVQADRIPAGVRPKSSSSQ